MMRRLALAFALAACFASPVLGQCRQALALGLDVSGSVDTREYQLQMRGLAAALTSPEVVALLLTMTQAPVEIAIFEWSGPRDQDVLVDWTRITSPADIEALVAPLRAAQRKPGSVGTALGTAMLTGRDLLMKRRACWRLTLDISGDGQRNMGPLPRDLRDRLAADGITVNALVIGADAPAIGDARQAEIAELSSYFRTNVITGPDAFVQTALGFEDYEAAMKRKLLRELELRNLSLHD